MKKKQIVFITSNEFKVKVANVSLEGTGVEVISRKMSCPEIQDEDVRKIAEYSAKYAAEKLQIPVLKNDCGFYIDALNGFPGPFMAYVERWISPEGFLKLMKGVENRKAKFVYCTTYCEPGKEPVSFVAETPGTISEKLEGKYGWGSDFFFIPEGKDKTMACFPDDERAKLWSDKNWKEFTKFIKSKNK